MFQDLSAMSNLIAESTKAQEEMEKKQALPPSTETGLTVVKSRAAIVADKKAEEAEKEKEKAKIWQQDQVPIEDALLCKDQNDDRPIPRYEFSYKQTVGTEDTFLGMNDKTNASSDCSHLIIKIHFPGSQMKDLDLDVTKNRIKAESKDLKLFTYLPVNVYSDKGKATFDAKRHVLQVTLPIIGFFDDEDKFT
jgi:hypothetical protein